MNRTFEVVSAPEHRPIKMWTQGVQVENQALQQLKNLAGMPFLHKHLAVMPDVQWGRGATVGSVFASKGAIIPAAVGVDVGCGMVAHQTSLTASDLPDNLVQMRSTIEAHVPHGRTDNGGVNDRGAWFNLPAFVEDAFRPTTELAHGLARIIEKHPKLDRPAVRRAPNHMSTLGTGNHFVELCLDGEQRVWVMLHSGSRGVGNKIGEYFISLAKQEMRRWFINLADQDLAYLPEGTEYFDDYIEAVEWAQGYARANRDCMMRQVLLAMRKQLGREFQTDCIAVNCHHNYVTKEHHFGDNVMLTRKGAVRARQGDLGIIPGSMGARSYIVRGLGNPESFHSCSHGAGRAMSRTEAKRKITLDEHIAATAHVECRKDKDVLDESPAAYKPIDAVIEAQRELIEVVHELTQILNVKG